MTEPIRVLRKNQFFHTDGFPIVVTRRDPQEPFGLHAHEFWEIVIITGGKGRHVTGVDSYELSAGDAFVIGGARPHDYQDLEELRLINILFDNDELPWDLGDLSEMPGYHTLFTLEPAFRQRHRFDSRLRLEPMDLAFAIETIEKLEHELNERSAGFRVQSMTLMMQLITFLARCYERCRTPRNQGLLEVADAIAHIEINYAEVITLDQLIKISNMSRRNFLRTFETAMGDSPIQYLIRLRIRKACERLRVSEKSITEIAMDVGFSDSNYFSRKFRDIIGMSPREYKRMYREIPLPTAGEPETAEASR
ncbi:helix-turn-helix domain-containing protein [Rhodopirellula sallentina]|uniref:L-rhamnose operon transcriptional activator n=1 Tax=Rhodopirellula sallentina SM41 TaxID=1263870 RepID=M5TZ52_9BACT|nr:helix-turn-helix domain-containing protein [Rhodopirellula sallentina]EMI54497.1 L-rhamnose operon transcriptional activator [Rhodopirellula sallentina SM41]